MFRKYIPWAALTTNLAILGSAWGAAPYAWTGAVIFALIVFVEALVLLLITGAPWPFPPWGRVLVAMLLFLVVLWYSAQDTLGAPAYVFVHQAWVVGIILVCLGFLIWDREISTRKSP